MIALPFDDVGQAWFEFLGRLHPAVLHLPIGLWLGLAALEYGGMIIRRQASRATMATRTPIGPPPITSTSSPAVSPDRRTS